MKFVPFELYEVMVTCESLLQTVAEVSAILHCVLYYALCVRTFMQKVSSLKEILHLGTSSRCSKFVH